jgi:shikimate dehydrogenase
MERHQVERGANSETAAGPSDARARADRDSARESDDRPRESDSRSPQSDGWPQEGPDRREGEAGRRAAVLGFPVAHSLSPSLHSAAYAALGLEGWSYERIECREPELDDLVAGLGPEWIGLSLTMPLKRVTLQVADRVSDLAAAVGAANTLVAGGSGWLADNTDVAGIVGALRENGVDRVERALVLGSGGTAQAALAALRDLGEPAPTVLVRDPSRAGELRATAERLGVRPVITGGLLDATFAPVDVVISTLPPGAADALLPQPWLGRPVLLDVIYAPWPTALAGSAFAAGCRVVGGLPVLLHQAAAQVELMTGKPAPVAVMRDALMASVAH